MPYKIKINYKIEDVIQDLNKKEEEIIIDIKECEPDYILLKKVTEKEIDVKTLTIFLNEKEGEW